MKYIGATIFRHKLRSQPENIQAIYYIMKRLIYIIALILAAAATGTMQAVTDKEMEQARVIATQAYLRYANDGSGYLDDLHPKTMAELERSLKPKEKENIKAFKAISLPGDYKSWDKTKLVDFWTKAFSTKGLIDKGRIGRKRAGSRINAMTIAAPAKPEAPKEEKATPASSPEKNGVQATTEAKSPATTPAVSPTPADSMAAAANEAELKAMQALEEEDPINKAQNHTWIYTLILIILVGVVVALVIFASNVMKKNGARPAMQPADAVPSEIPPTDQRAAAMEANSLREKFAARLTEKNKEVAALNRKVEELASANSALQGKVETLTSENATLRARLSDALRKEAELEKAVSLATVQPAVAQHDTAPAQPSRQTAPQASSQQPTRQGTPLRTIYLGRANSKGIFVRADRSLNVGNSVFRLDTTDGYAGSFRVVDDPTVWDMAMLTPRESLAGACVSPDLDNTDGKEKIVNDSSGTAVFEGGCWKVIRKAKIHYE